MPSDTPTRDTPAEAGAQPFDDVRDPPPGLHQKPEVRNPSGAFPRYQKFSQFIAEAEYGQLDADLSATLQQLVATCVDYALSHSGKVEAQLNLKLKFKLKDGLFSIESDPSMKLPKEERGITVCWTTPDGFLTPQDPKQLTMFGGRQVMTDHNRGRPVRMA